MPVDSPEDIERQRQPEEGSSFSTWILLVVASCAIGGAVIYTMTYGGGVQNNHAVSTVQ